MGRRRRGAGGGEGGEATEFVYHEVRVLACGLGFQYSDGIFDVVGETAAMFAATSMAFKDANPVYARSRGGGS